MSHDDPRATEATKNPPCRGGSSFLRTGSPPSLARMRARWAAFCLAAAVLLGGSRALADDGVYVHIDSPLPAELAALGPHHVGRVGRSVYGYSEKLPVCSSPCDSRIYLSPGAQRYVITGAFPERLSMWQAENADWSLYLLEGCGATTVYRCHRLGKCGVNMQ